MTYYPTGAFNIFWLMKMKMVLKNQTILKVTGEGCQGISEFKWIGKVIGFRTNKEQEWDEVVIKICKHNNSYHDSRDNEKDEIYTYPLINNDIQNVNGVWILFT